MDLMPNSTVLPMWVIYVTSVLILNFFMFQPTLRILKKRQELTVGLDGEAQNFRNQTSTKLSEYEKLMAEAKKLAKTAREEIIESAETQQEEIISLARQKADTHISKIKDQIKSESDVALRQLHEAVPAIATAIFEKLIDRRAA